MYSDICEHFNQTPCEIESLFLLICFGIQTIRYLSYSFNNFQFDDREECFSQSVGLIVVFGITGIVFFCKPDLKHFDSTSLWMVPRLVYLSLTTTKNDMFLIIMVDTWQDAAQNKSLESLTDVLVQWIFFFVFDDVLQANHYIYFFKGAQAWGWTWDLLVFVYLLLLKQHLRPLGYCSPLSKPLYLLFS